MSLTSDGSLLFCGGTAIQVQLWRVPEFVNCLRLSGFNDITLRLALSSDESRLYCAEGKSMSIFPIQVRRWNAVDEMEIQVQRDPPQPTFSPL